MREKILGMLIGIGSVMLIFSIVNFSSLRTPLEKIVILVFVSFSLGFWFYKILSLTTSLSKFLKFGISSLVVVSSVFTSSLFFYPDHIGIITYRDNTVRITDEPVFVGLFSVLETKQVPRDMSVKISIISGKEIYSARITFSFPTDKETTLKYLMDYGSINEWLKKTLTQAIPRIEEVLKIAGYPTKIELSPNGSWEIDGIRVKLIEIEKLL